MPFRCVADGGLAVVVAGFSYLCERYYLLATLYVIAIEHYCISLLVDVLVEHGVDGSVVMSVQFVHILVGEFLASLILVPAFQLLRFGAEAEWATVLGCLHRIAQGIGGIKLSDEEVAGSDRLLHHIGELAGALGGELHALALVAVFYHRGRIFLRFCRWVADLESRVSGSPDVEEIAIPVFQL